MKGVRSVLEFDNEWPQIGMRRPGCVAQKVARLTQEPVFSQNYNTDFTNFKVTE